MSQPREERSTRSELTEGRSHGSLAWPTLIATRCSLNHLEVCRKRFHDQFVISSLMRKSCARWLSSSLLFSRRVLFAVTRLTKCCFSSTRAVLLKLTKKKKKKKKESFLFYYSQLTRHRHIQQLDSRTLVNVTNVDDDDWLKEGKRFEKLPVLSRQRSFPSCARR